MNLKKQSLSASPDSKIAAITEGKATTPSQSVEVTEQKKKKRGVGRLRGH